MRASYWEALFLFATEFTGAGLQDPEEWDEAEQGERSEKDEALHASFAVGEAVGVDALDDVVAGGGDEDGSGSDGERGERARRLGHAHDERIDVGDAHDGGQSIDACRAQVGDGKLSGDEHGEEQRGKDEGRAEFEGIGGLELTLDGLSGGIGAARPEPAGEDSDRCEDQEGQIEQRHQAAIEEREQDRKAEIHNSGGDEDAAGEEVGVLLLFGAARHDDRGDGRRVGAAEKGREHDAALGFGELLQDVTAVGNGADGDDNEPGFEGIDVEAGELLTRQDGKNDGGEEKELGEGEDLTRSDAAGELFEGDFEVEQQQAGDAESGGDPEMSVADEGADEERGEAGHFRGDAGDFGFGELVPVGEEQEAGDDEEADGEREKLVSGEQGDGIADEADEGKGADAAEGVRAGLGFVVLAFQSDEEGEEEDEEDFDGVGRQVRVDLHGSLGLSAGSSPA